MLELPIVSTLHNGIPEQVIDGATGFLVKEFDYEAMADLIVQLLLDPALSAQMGSEGRQWIGELCQSERRFCEINRLIKSACR